MVEMVVKTEQEYCMVEVTSEVEIVLARRGSPIRLGGLYLPFILSLLGDTVDPNHCFNMAKVIANAISN